RVTSDPSLHDALPIYDRPENGSRSTPVHQELRFTGMTGRRCTTGRSGHANLSRLTRTPPDESARRWPMDFDLGRNPTAAMRALRSEEHTSELQSRENL